MKLLSKILKFEVLMYVIKINMVKTLYLTFCIKATILVVKIPNTLAMYVHKKMNIYHLHEMLIFEWTLTFAYFLGRSSHSLDDVYAF